MECVDNITKKSNNTSVGSSGNRFIRSSGNRFIMNDDDIIEIYNIIINDININNINSIN
jgi:hypothetical protein